MCLAHNPTAIVVQLVLISKFDFLETLIPVVTLLVKCRLKFVNCQLGHPADNQIITIIDKPESEVQV